MPRKPRGRNLFETESDGILPGRVRPTSGRLNRRPGPEPGHPARPPAWHGCSAAGRKRSPRRAPGCRPTPREPPRRPRRLRRPGGVDAPLAPPSALTHDAEDGARAGGLAGRFEARSAAPRRRCPRRPRRSRRRDRGTPRRSGRGSRRRSRVQAGSPARAAGWMPRAGEDTSRITSTPAATATAPTPTPMATCPRREGCSSKVSYSATETIYGIQVTSEKLPLRHEVVEGRFQRDARAVAKVTNVNVNAAVAIKAGKVRATSRASPGPTSPGRPPRRSRRWAGPLPKSRTPPATSTPEPPN
jgi:hypothetical protein